MTYIKQYDIHPTTTFKEEVKEIYRYLAITLREPSVANNLYRKIRRKIDTLKYLPERYSGISNLNQNIRRLLVDNYVIVYEIKKDTWSNIYFTYFSL